MLGKTAGGLYWMFRYLERSENTARLVEAGFRIALTRSTDDEDEWKSVVSTAAVSAGYRAKYDVWNATNVVDYLLRDPANESSVISSCERARTNARMVRTALTTEVWEAVNENWMNLKEVLKSPVKQTELPLVLATIRQQSALVRGAMHGTMMRNDMYDFAQIGSALERADNTARIIDVKKDKLVSSPEDTEASLDNVQWEMILRSVSAHRAFRWFNEKEMSPAAIADFLILDARFPRSLAFCAKHLVANLEYLAKDYGQRVPANDLADDLRRKLKKSNVGSIFDSGLNEFLADFFLYNKAVAMQIEKDYRFNG